MEGVLVGPGTVLAGRYTLEREVGRGGMATVYLARDSRHNRAVAVKILRAEIAAWLGHERFLREIQIAAGLTHPHILPLYDSGEAGGLLFYVMPYVDGESLRDRIQREGRLPHEDARRIAREVADALSYAHSHNIVHRDIKPGNILLEGRHAVVADFGIARALSQAGGEELTTSGLVIGTPMYMSPEQVSGSQLDGRSDLYSLGCVLHEMVLGEPPFKGPSPHVIASRQLYEDLPPIAAFDATLPPDISGTIEKALAKSPSDRFEDAAAFADALATSGTHGIAPPPVRRPRRKWSYGATVAVLLVAVVFLWRYVADLGTPRQPTWVLVSEFEGSPGLGNVTDAIRELVTAELDQSRYVAAMPRQQLKSVMRDAGLPDSASLTPDRARELALRSSVRAILTGSVQAIRPSEYSIIVRAIDAEDGKPILTASEAATDHDLVSKAQALGRQIRRGLGERRSEIESNRRLTQVATPSFEAYRKYSDALSLAAKADVDGSNRLLREAIALDTGFASAWASLSVNYAMAGDVDSSRLALVEALKRPDRLNAAHRYSLEAEAAYQLHYDLPSAVRWYDLHLEHAPQSLKGHNNKGVYLSSMGRYEEALAEFRSAAAIDPFGRGHAQPQVFNETAMLIALGRPVEARASAQLLTGAFGAYAALLQATSEGQWKAAESLAIGPATAAVTPAWLKAPAVTMWAGALASRGAVSSAEQILRRAEARSPRSASYRYRHALVVLTLSSGRPAAPASGSQLVRDSAPGGLLLRGIVSALQGNVREAGESLDKLQALPPVEQLRLGDGLAFLEACIARAEGRWDQIRRLLGAPATEGEHDGSIPAQVSSLAMRLLLADAYEHTGRLDSAAAYLELAIAPTRVPFSHVALRGFAYPFVQRRLALLYGKLGQDELAMERLKGFAAAFTDPDPDLKPLIMADVSGRETGQSIVQ
jgi:serine/threonine-protein kinase